MLYPPQLTRGFSAALRVEIREPREGGPELTRTVPPLPGEHPEGRPVSGRKRRGSRFPFRFKNLLSILPPTPVSTPLLRITDERREIKVDTRGWQYASEAGRGSPFAGGAPPGGAGSGGEAGRLCPPRRPRGCQFPVPVPPPPPPGQSPARPQAGPNTQAGGFSSPSTCRSPLRSRLHGPRKPARPPGGRAAHGPGPRSAASRRAGLGRARPSQRRRVPVPPAPATARGGAWLHLSFLFFFKWDKLNLRSGTGRCKGTGRRGRPRRAAGLPRR